MGKNSKHFLEKKKLLTMLCEFPRDSCILTTDYIEIIGSDVVHEIKLLCIFKFFIQISNEDFTFLVKYKTMLFENV